MKNNLKKLRTGKALSQDELSDLTGISQTMISAFERGVKGISLDYGFKIANALGCNINDLVDGNTQSGNVSGKAAI
jgi:transcriptional regulator with XRE-family HTH domain